MATDPGSTTNIRLTFLTDDEDARELCRLYWQVDTMGEFVHAVADVGDRFGMPGWKVSSAVGEYGFASLEGDCCSACDQPLALRTRMDLRRRRGIGRYGRELQSDICAACREAKHREANRQAEEAARARASLLQEAARARTILLEEEIMRLRQGWRWLPPQLLSFEHAIYLASLFRAGGSDDMSYVVPYRHFKSPLSPTPTLDREILLQLFHNRIIAIHPGSHLEAVEFKGHDYNSLSFEPRHVHWVLPLPATAPPALYLEDLEDLLRSPDKWPEDWHEDAPALRRKIALEECLAYLELSLTDHGFTLRRGDKLLMVMRSLLDDFSIGQIYNLIWKAVEHAAAFSLRQRISRPHAVNTVPGSIQRYAERALAEGWNVKPYRRDRRAPESYVSHVLFTTALGLPGGGLEWVPDAEVATEEGE